MKSLIMDGPSVSSVNIFLSIPIILLGTTKLVSFTFIKSASRIWNLSLLVLFLASASGVLFTARVSNIAFGDIPIFHFPLALCTIFPTAIEIVTLLHLAENRVLKLLCLIYISLSALTKTIFSLLLPLLYLGLYRLVTVVLALDNSFLAIMYFLVSRWTVGSHVVLQRRMIDFLGVTLCVSTFSVLGIMYPSVWATLNEVLVILITGFICLAQPLIVKGSQGVIGLRNGNARSLRRLEDFIEDTSSYPVNGEAGS